MAIQPGGGRVPVAITRTPVPDGTPGLESHEIGDGTLQDVGVEASELAEKVMEVWDLGKRLKRLRLFVPG